MSFILHLCFMKRFWSPDYLDPLCSTSCVVMLHSCKATAVSTAFVPYNSYVTPTQGPYVALPEADNQTPLGILVLHCASERFSQIWPTLNSNRLLFIALDRSTSLRMHMWWLCSFKTNACKFEVLVADMMYKYLIHLEQLACFPKWFGKKKKCWDLLALKLWCSSINIWFKKKLIGS